MLVRSDMVMLLSFRSMLLSGTWSLRINRLHQYLIENLPAYSSSGCAIYPPAGLELAPAGPTPTEVTLVYKSYPQNLTNPSDIEGETKLQIDVQLTPGTYLSQQRRCFFTWPRSPVGNVSDCRSRGCEFNPGPVPYFCGDRL